MTTTPDANISTSAVTEQAVNSGTSAESAAVPEKAKKFNWWAFLFCSYYYAGYNQLKKASLFFAISMIIPFSSILVGIYAGFKAKEDIDQKNTNYNWKVFGIFFTVTTLITIIYWSLLDSALNGLPSCDSSETEDVIAEIITDNTRFEYVGMEGITERSHNPERGIRLCKANLITDRGEENITFKVTWQDEKQESFYVEILN